MNRSGSVFGLRRSSGRPLRRSTLPGMDGAAPACEGLEPRLALSGEVNANGALVIIGGPDADAIELEVEETLAGFGIVIVRGVPGVPDGTEFSGVERINVDLKSGADTLEVIGTPRTPEGDAADVRVKGGNGADVIAANGGFVDLRGGNGPDTLTGGEADDLIKGGKHGDRLFGGMGNDEIHGQNGPDLLVGRHGDDLLLGGNGLDELWGGQSADTLRGGKGADVGWGGQGVDEVFGEGGSDRFNCADEEAMDFEDGDLNWSASHGAEFGQALPGPTFWNRVAQPESQVASDGVLSEGAVSTVNALADAFADARVEFAAFLLGVQDEMGPQGSPERLELLAALRTFTNAWSPPIAANPPLLTPSALDQLVGDLAEAAAATCPAPVAEMYQSWVDTLALALINEGFHSNFQELEDLDEANAILFGFDSIMNLTDPL